MKEAALASAQGNRSSAKEMLTGMFKRRKGGGAADTATAAATGGASAAASTAEVLTGKEARALQKTVASLEAERSKLQDTVRNQEAEIALHKETKDQLTRQIKATQVDIDDQRRVYKAQISDLNNKNKMLTAELRDVQAQRDRARREQAADAAAVAEAPAPSQPLTADQPKGKKASAAAEGAAEEAPAESSDTGKAAAEIEALREALREATQARDMLQLRLDRHTQDLQGEITDTDSLREQLRHLNVKLSEMQDELSAASVRGGDREGAGCGERAKKKYEQRPACLHGWKSKARAAAYWMRRSSLSLGCTLAYITALGQRAPGTKGT